MFGTTIWYKLFNKVQALFWSPIHILWYKCITMQDWQSVNPNVSACWWNQSQDKIKNNTRNKRTKTDSVFNCRTLRVVWPSTDLGLNSRHILLPSKFSGITFPPKSLIFHVDLTIVSDKKLWGQKNLTEESSIRSLELQ